MLPPLMPKPLKVKTYRKKSTSLTEQPLPARLANDGVRQPLRVIGTPRTGGHRRPLLQVLKTLGITDDAS